MEMLVVILVIIILTIMSEYNKVDNKRNKLKSSWNSINSLLKQKADYLSKIIEAFMFKLKDDNDLLEKTTSLKSTLLSGSNTEKLYANDKLEELIPLLKDAAEKDDELKSNESFVKLFDNISLIDVRINDLKKIYNNAVDDYNQIFKKFPSKIIADKFRFKEESHLK